MYYYNLPRLQKDHTPQALSKHQTKGILLDIFPEANMPLVPKTEMLQKMKLQAVYLINSDTKHSQDDFRELKPK